METITIKIAKLHDISDKKRVNGIITGTGENKHEQLWFIIMGGYKIRVMDSAECYSFEYGYQSGLWRWL